MPARADHQEIIAANGADEHVGGIARDDLALDLDTVGIFRDLGDRPLKQILGRSVDLTLFDRTERAEGNRARRL